jgi:menaquinone-dependent protoporphyrinogen IX oxidase
MKIMIAYYSWQGHTQKVVEELASKLEAHLERIEPVKESGMATKGMKAALGLKADIKPFKTDISDLDYLVVATPVWAGHWTPYINKYISMLSGCSEKPFSALVEMRGRGGDKTIQQIRTALEKKGMQYVSSAMTIEADVEANNFSETVSELAKSIKNFEQ